MSGPDDLRVGDAERTRVTEALHDHFAQGRLTQDELEERLDATLAAKTVGDLRQVTHDLPPAAPSAPPTVPRPVYRRPRPPFFALFVAMFLIVAALTSGPWGPLVGVIKVIFVGWLVMALLGFMRARRRHWHRHRHWQSWGGPWGYGPPRGRRWR